MPFSFLRSELRNPLAAQPGEIQDLYEPLEYDYFQAIRNHAFDYRHAPTVFVPASGSDISSVLLLTNAKQAVFVDVLPFDTARKWESKKLSDYFEEYFAMKKNLTWSTGPLLRKVGSLRVFVEEELKRIGAKEVSLSSVSGDSHIHEVRFQWAYPGQEMMARQFLFAGNKNIKQVSQSDIKMWSELLRQPPLMSHDLAGKNNPVFDGMVIKAGEYSTSWIENPSGLVVKMIPYFKRNNSILSDIAIQAGPGQGIVELKTSGEMMELERQGARFGYGVEFSDLMPGIKKGVYLYEVIPPESAEADSARSELRTKKAGFILRQAGMTKAEALELLKRSKWNLKKLKEDLLRSHPSIKFGAISQADLM
ncbi:MAG: hypothetical protein ACRENF_08015, partial [Thermodesulfobacteriota bacterium]